MSKLKKISSYSLLGLFLIALPVAALAVNYQVNDSTDVNENEIIDGNYIKVASIIEVNGAVNGDVIVAGNSIKITGPVAGDVIAAGKNIKISGPVGGSIRLVGSVIEITSGVEKNIWAMGNSVVVNRETTVGWDVFSAGSTVEIRGKVNGNIWAAAATVVVESAVGKDLNVAVNHNGQAILLPNARVGGNLNYQAWSLEQLDIQDGAQVSGEIIKKDLSEIDKSLMREILTPLSIFIKIVLLFSLLVVGLIFISLVPKIALDVHEQMVKKFWPAVGTGLIYVSVTPLVMILLMFTVIGIPLALMILPLYLISLYLSKVLVGLSIGLLIISNLTKDKKRQGSLVWPLVLGLVVLVIIGSLPVIGWIVRLVAMCWALGALIQVKKDILKEYR